MCPQPYLSKMNRGQRYFLLAQFPAPLIPAGAFWCGVLCVPHQASSRSLIDLLAFLFISSPGCKCNTKGTISGIAECQQVGLLPSASRHPRAGGAVGVFQLRLSQQLLESPVLTLSSQRLHRRLGLRENTGLRPVIN